MVFIVLGLAGLLWVWLGLGTAMPTPQTNSYTNPYSYSSQDITTPPSNTPDSTTGSAPAAQAQPQAQPSFNEAYAQLWLHLAAQPISYTTANSSSGGDLAALYKLYVDDIKIAKQYSATSGDLTVDVAMADITNDGVPEAFVYNNLPGFCGSGGCVLDIYQKKSGSWKKIFSVSASGEEVGLTNALTQGYLGFFVTVPGAVGSQPNVVRFVWDGSTYQQKQTVAVWDGSQFQFLP